MHTNVIIIQLFWLSFSFIGLAWFLVLYRFSGRDFKKLLASRHPLVLLFISTALGLAWLGLIMVPAYFLSLSTKLVSLAYVFSLLGSLAVLFYERKRLWAYTLKIKTLPPKNLFWIVPLICLVAAFYFIAGRSGGSLALDSQVHMSRATAVAAGQLNFKGPYFGYNGVYDVRYSINLLNSLMGVLTEAFNIPVLTVWLYSYAWIVLLSLLGIFSFCWEMFSGKGRALVAYGSLALAPFLLSWYFLEAEMPTREVLLWIILLLIGLKWLYKTGNAAFLLIAAALIAMTQPLYCVMGVGFLVLLALVLAAAKSLNKKIAWSLAIAAGILILPIIQQLIYPNLIKQDPAAFNAIDGTYGTIHLHNYGPFLISKIRPVFSFWQFLAYGLLLAAAWFSRQLKNWLAVVAIGLAALALEVKAYSPTLLIIIGTVYLIAVTKNLKLRLTFAVMALFYSLVAYNPILFKLTENKVPLWFFVRFQGWNVLVLLVLVLGLFVLHVWPVLNRKLTSPQWSTLALLGLVVVGLLLAPKRYNYRLSVDTAPQKTYIETLAVITELEPQLKHKTLMSDDAELILRVPTVVKTNTLSFEHSQNATPMANLPLRKACNSLLIKNMNPADLLAAGVNTIITKSSNPEFIALINSKPFIKLEKTIADTSVYSVNLNPHLYKANPNSICNIPYGQ